MNPTFRNAEVRHGTRSQSVSQDRQQSRAVLLAEAGLGGDAELSSGDTKSESARSPWTSILPEAMKRATHSPSRGRSRGRSRSHDRSRSKSSMDRMESSLQAHVIVPDVFFGGGTENNEDGVRRNSIAGGGGGGVRGGMTARGMEPAVKSWGLVTVETFLKLVCCCLFLLYQVRSWGVKPPCFAVDRFGVAYKTTLDHGALVLFDVETGLDRSLLRAYGFIFTTTPHNYCCFFLSLTN